MTYNALQIANWFVNRAKRDGGTLSIMTLLKLTYIAHGWHLETHDKPLFSNRIEAWKYGPVIREVYNGFRNQGILVSREVSATGPEISEATNGFLDQIYDIYGTMDAFRLSDLTHVAGGPWDLATQMGGNHAPIPDELIKQHYVMKRANSVDHIANE